MAFGMSGRDMVRIDPMSANRSNMPGFDKMSDKTAEAKLLELRNGAELTQMNPPLPRRRKCQDAIWIAIFFLTVTAVLVAAYVYSATVYEKSVLAGANSVFEETVDVERDGAVEVEEEEYNPNDPPSSQEQNIWTLISSGIVGACAAALAAFGYIFLAHAAPACVVYTSLFLSPALLCIAGIVCVVCGISAGGSMGTMLIIMGCVCIFLGICIGSCVLCCWQHLIPFMITLVEVTTGIIEDYIGVLLLGLLGAVLGILWSTLCFTAFFGIYLENRDHFHDHEHSKHISKAFTFICSLVYYWGIMVQVNVCHVAYCGVFGRWYYGRTGPTEERVLAGSVRVALTTSFGSVCFGSVLIAAIRALEITVRQFRQEAAQDGNIACCVMFLILECVISCIGDILEYFNAFAYVTCAVRGVSFCEAAKITYSMMTCSNMQYVIRDLLLDSVVELGALICAVVGGVAGAIVGAVASASVPIIGGGAIFGFVTGYAAGVAVVGVISSGIKTILVCWADNPNPLADSHPEVHEEFVERINGGYAIEMEKR